MSVIPLRSGYERRAESPTRRERERSLIIPYVSLPKSQTRNAWETKLSSSFDEYVPFSHNYDLYNTIRNLIPLVEACYTKYKMLVAEPEFDFFGNRQAEAMAREFIDKVRVNQFGSGLHEWLVGLVDSGLHYGNGYGELVPTLALNGVAYLKNAPSTFIRFVKDKEGNLTLGQYDEMGMSVVPFERQDFIYHLAFWKRDGHPQGYSLLYSLPFVSQIMFYIQTSLKKTWIRVGDPTFAFFIETDKEMATAADYDSSREAIAQLEAKWITVQEAKLMGKYGDVTGAPPPGSKVVIKTLGEGLNLPDLEVSMRTVVEQIVAQTGFPLFMFGFHWGGNYNLTTHQNDMIVNQISFIRKCINPIIDRVFRQMFLLKGLVNVKFAWEWPEVNLRDEVEQARARQMRAQAVKLTLEALMEAFDYGLASAEAITRFLVEEGLEDEKQLKVLGQEKFFSLVRRKYELARAMELAGRLGN